MSTERDVYDITIVGGGPTGLFATFYAGLRQMKTKLIDALEELGGQVEVLYPEKYVYDVGGFPKITGKELVKGMVEQALRLNPTVVLGERIVSVKTMADGVIALESAMGNIHYSRTVLIAAGVGAFSPNRLEAAGAAPFEGKGVYYFLKDKNLMKDKRLLIVGGGDSAVDWALNLNNWAKHITLVHRRDIFRAHEESVSEMMRCGVDVRLFYELKEVLCEGDRITGAVIYDNRTKEETKLEIDAILVNIGFRADLGPIKDWGLEISGRELRASGKLETNIPGVFVAGDIASPEGTVKMNLIVTGFAQAAVAVNVAKNHIDPKARIFPGHSSEMKISG
ncbi:MAG: NAD(P)/FAD-dependent oxidoreductase [Thaumarchaeota archaeon]|nr:NAD(P)/FAD-dependent oxidoreductase [Nitrososphaerota archaeon]